MPLWMPTNPRRTTNGPRPVPPQNPDRPLPVDGLLLLNKPAGISSNQALQRVKRMLKARKAGHTGALDPAATGMLPLCFGEATKVSAFLLQADKTYRVVARLGRATDTGDRDGTETQTSAVPALDAAEWDAILQSFRGESAQIPPMYSALKKDGKRLYQLARQGQVVAREPRLIVLKSIDLLEVAGHRLVFRVHCSKGTYIRTLVEDIAARAGTVAYTQHLHRESVAGFEASAMVDLATAEALAADGAEGLRERLLAPDRALLGLPPVILDNLAAARFRQGMAVESDGAEAGLVRVYGPDGEAAFLGVGEAAGDGRVAPKRVFAVP
jgi:tRNA pseudouridine55 synthase